MRILPVTLLISLLMFDNIGARRAPKKLEKKIDEFVAGILKCREVVGLTLTIVEGGETLLAKGYGLTELGKDKKVTNTTLFCIASLSKAFASTLLGSLLSNNRKGYNWDTPVRDILGEEFYFNDAHLTRHVTLRDLLSHISGIAAHSRIRLQDNLSRKQLARSMRFFKAVKELRTTRIYNNMMYGLVAHVTETLGGKPWEDLVHEKLFTPLRMKSSSFTNTFDWQNADNYATPYMVEKNGSFRKVSHKLLSHWGTFGGSGSILSNAVDMAEWLKLQLHDGFSHDGRQVVPSDVIRDTRQPIIPIQDSGAMKIYRKPQAPVSYIIDRYAMGWMNGYYRGWPIITHTGTSWGYGSILTIVPDMGIGIYTSVNGPDRGYYGRRELHLYIMDLLLGEKPWFNSSSECEIAKTKNVKTPRTHIEKSKKLNHPPQVYMGTYGNFGYGNVTVDYDQQKETLILKYGTYGNWYLHPTNGSSTFKGVGFGITWVMQISSVIFEDLDTNKRQMLTLLVPSFERSDPPVFKRGLRMSDAPLPPDLQCTPNCAFTLNISLKVFTVIMLSWLEWCLIVM